MIRKRKAVESISDEEEEKSDTNTQPNADGSENDEETEDEDERPDAKPKIFRDWDMLQNDNQYTLELERWEHNPSLEVEWLIKVRQAPFMTQKDSNEWWSLLLEWWTFAERRHCYFISVVEAAWGKPADWLVFGEFEKTKRDLKQIELRYPIFSIPRLTATLQKRKRPIVFRFGDLLTLSLAKEWNGWRVFTDMHFHCGFRMKCVIMVERTSITAVHCMRIVCTPK